MSSLSYHITYHLGISMIILLLLLLLLLLQINAINIDNNENNINNSENKIIFYRKEKKKIFHL